MNEKKVFLQGLSSGMFVKLSSAILSFLIIPIYINYFGNNDYGSIIVLTTAISIASIINIGLPSAIATIGAQSFTYTKVYYLFKSTFFSYIIYLFLCLLLLTFLFGHFNTFIFDSLLKSSLTINHPIFLALIIIASAISAYIQSLFTALHKLHLSNVIQGFATLQYPLALLITIFFNENIQFYFSIASLFACINIIIFLFIYLKFYIPGEEVESPSDYFHSKRNIAITSLTALSITIISLIINQVDILIISYYLTKIEVVQYSILAKIIGLEILLYGVFFSAITPLIAKWYRQNNFDKIKLIHSVSFNIMSVIGGIILLGNILFMQNFITLWVGESQYIGTINVLMYSLFIYLFGMYSINYITYSSFNIKRKMTLIASMLEPSIKIILSILFTKYFGISGTLASMLFLGLFITFPLTTFFLYNFSNGLIQVNLSYTFKNFFLLIFPLLSVSYYLSSLNTLLSIPVAFLFIAIYLIGSWYQLDLNERDQAIQLFRKRHE